MTNKQNSLCPEFWDWLPKAYRDGDIGDEPRFTKYNMEVAFLAGKQSAALEAKDKPVAWVGLTDEDIRPLCKQTWVFDTVKQWAVIIDAILKDKNT